jgi:hypothetical protein
MLNDPAPPTTPSHDFSTCDIPIESLITLIYLPQQEIIENAKEVVVVGFVVKRECAAVFKKSAKLGRKFLIQAIRGDGLFAFEHVLLPQALPWQRAPKKVKKNISEGLQVIPPSKLQAQMAIDRCEGSSSSEAKTLLIWNVGVCLGIPKLL